MHLSVIKGNPVAENLESRNMQLRPHRVHFQNKSEKSSV